MAASHHVGEFAFDFGSGGAVVGGPFRIGLTGTVVGQVLLVAAHGNGAATGGGGALGTQRAAGASVCEGGGPVTVFVAADRHAHLAWAGDGVGVEVDLGQGFGKQPACGDWWLGLATRANPVTGKVIQELAGAVGGITVDLRPLICSVGVTTGLAALARGELGLTSGFTGGLASLGSASRGRLRWGVATWLLAAPATTTTAAPDSRAGARQVTACPARIGNAVVVSAPVVSIVDGLGVLNWQIAGLVGAAGLVGDILDEVLGRGRVTDVAAA